MQFGDGMVQYIAPSQVRYSGCRRVKIGQPVALLIDEDAELGEIVNGVGFRFFTDPEMLKKYVREEVIAQLPVAV